MEQYKLSFQTEQEAAALVSKEVKEVNIVKVENGDCKADANPYKRDNWGRGAEFLFSCIGKEK